MSPSRRLVRALSVGAVLVVMVTTGCDPGGSAEPTPTDGSATRTGGPALSAMLARAAETTAELDEPRRTTIRFGVHIDEHTVRGKRRAHYDPRTGTGTVRLSGSDARGRVLLTGDRAYLRLDQPEFEKALPKDAQYVASPPKRLHRLHVIPPLQDNVAAVYLLLGAHDARLVDTKDGKHTYRFAVDEDEAVEAAPEKRRDTVDNLLGLDSAYHRKVKATAVIDSDDRVRRLELHQSADTAPQGPEREHVKTYRELSLTDIGASVDVTAPPARQVVSLAKAPKVRDLLAGR